MEWNGYPVERWAGEGRGRREGAKGCFIARFRYSCENSGINEESFFL